MRCLVYSINYFPNKDALILSTISSIWKEALEKLKKENDIISALDGVYSVIMAVDSDYSGFLSTHAALLKGKTEGRDEMNEVIDRIKDYLYSALDNDIKEKIKNNMKEDEFLSFLMANIILSVMKREEPKVLKKLILKFL